MVSEHVGSSGFCVDKVGEGRIRDRELYARMLGIEAPWRVEGVEWKLEEGEVVV